MKSTNEEERQQKPATGGDVATEGEDFQGARAAETLLRAAPMGLCLAALAIMVKNSQEGDFGSISYSDLAAFKSVNLDLYPLIVFLLLVTCSRECPSDFSMWKIRYLVYANGACAAYSLLSAFYFAIPRPATLSRSWTVFLLDQARLN